MSILSDESRPLINVAADVADPRAGSDPGIGAEARAQANYRFYAVALVAVATLIRFVSVARLPLANGEAYYATWSHFLAWSYYDHPPLVAWMVRLTTALGESSAAIRLGPVLCAGAFGLLFYRLAERFFGPRAAFLSLVLVTALPVFLISSIVLNPEAPLAPLWVGYLLVLEGMRERDEAYRPLLAGVLLGCAFLAKYTAVLLVPTTFLYLAFSAPTRRWLRRPSLYVGGVIALFLALPVLMWNEAHGWPTLRLHLVDRAAVTIPVSGENAINHLMEDASTTGTSGLQAFFRLLVGQVLSYSPLLMPALAMALFRTLRRARHDDRDLFLASFSWPVLILILAAMLRVKDAEQHWTMVAFIPAAIAAGRYADETWTSAKRFSLLAATGVALSALGFAVGVVATHSDAVIRLLAPAHYDPRADLSNEMAGWDQVRASVEAAARATKGDVVLASNHYAMCGRLLMETSDAPNVYCPTARRSAFDFFGRRTPPADATIITLTNDVESDFPASAGLGGPDGRACVLADDVVIERAGRQVARYFVHSCPPVQAAEKRASRD